MNAAETLFAVPVEESFAYLPVWQEVVLKFRVKMPAQDVPKTATLILGGQSWNGALSSPEDAADSFEAVFHVRLPQTADEHPWRLTLGEDGSSAEGVLRTQPLRVRLMSYGAPAVLFDEPRARFHVTACCIDGVTMAGKQIEIFSLNDPSVSLGVWTLSNEPEPKSQGVFRADIEIDIPLEAGLYQYGARLADGAVPLACDASECAVSIERAPQTLEELRVTVLDAESEAPLEGVAVRSGKYQTMTEADGRAVLRVPPGPVTVICYKSSYDIPQAQTEISGPSELVVKGRFVPPPPPPWEQ